MESNTNGNVKLYKKGDVAYDDRQAGPAGGIVMPDNNELVNMFCAVIQEELKPVNERLSALEAGQQELKQGQNGFGKQS
jgi:hypothetical protein